MPLSPMELHDEALGQLRRLVQSPGWDLYSSLVLKRVQSSEQEKAKGLREALFEQALWLQGQIDGLRAALDLLPQEIDRLEAEVHPAEPIGSYA